MAFYRKRPLVIEARPVVAGVYFGDWEGVDVNQPEGAAYVETPEGTMKAEYGDWIIKGVKGEFYPCKPDVFAQTYEEVSP